MIPVICIPLNTNAQVISRYNTFSYGVNEGLLQTTISDIEVDKNNFCWISFPNGIQKFDGNNFINIPVQPGLPDDKSADFFRCANGDLLLSHNQGISRYNIATDNFSLLYKQPAEQQHYLRFIGESEGIIYCYKETGSVISFRSNDLSLISVFETGIPRSSPASNMRSILSDNIINHKSAVKIGTNLYLLDLKEKKIAGKAVIEPLFFSFLLKLKNEREVYYYDNRNTNALQYWNFITGNNTSLPVEGKDNMPFGRCVIYPWGSKTLLSFSNRLFEADKDLIKLKTELVSFQNLPPAGESAIHRIREDNFGNLYLQTVTGGIRKIIRNNYPIKYFGTPEQKVNNILAILSDKKNNRILTGGTGGLFVFDTLQRLIKHFTTAPEAGNVFNPNGIIQANNGDYFIFSFGSNKVWRLNKSLQTLIPISMTSNLPAGKSYAQFFGNPLLNSGHQALFQTEHKLYRIDFSSNKIFEHPFSNAYAMAGLWYNGMIISHAANELIFLDGLTFKELKKISFKEPNGVRCLVAGPDGGIYAGGNKGIFKIDTTGKILNQWNKQTGLPDECIYAIAFDKEGGLWCSTNKGILKIDAGSQVLQITKQDGLQENEFNTNVLAVAEDGEMYFGGINGVSSFYPSSISGFDDTLHLLVTGIKANNTVVDTSTASWNIQHVKLTYRQNALSFDFVAMGSNNPGQYVYQYKMEGVDKEWIRNNDMQTVRYSLSPGTYTFQLYASRSFDKDAKPMKEIRIIILPPFWKAWWFRTGLGLLVLALLYYFINQRTKRKYAEKLRQLESEKQLQEERERISKDLHDSLGAYANAVLYNTELLEKEKTDEKRTVLFGDLRFASKDIITALRETVWALKKEEYTAEDCLVRIRNFIQPFAKYYLLIQFTVDGEAPAGLKLHYTKALNLVRIVQEAVSNSIKHASPSSISVIAAIYEDKWRLTINDNGSGFDYVSLKDDQRGNGLTNMLHRAAESEFKINIESKINEGTSITIIV